MISVKNLKFSYKNENAETLKGLTFNIKEGEILGFLGPSGAGKSTTQNILTKLLTGFSGDVDIMGRPLSSWGNDYYEHIGVSFELPNHYLKLSAIENLLHFKSLYNVGTENPMELLARVGLDGAAHKRVASFSKGMKIRLNVARSLINKPKILFLDEPTSGLDPVNSKNIKELILEKRAQGTTVFVTTHNMSFAEELCQRVAFLANGRIGIIDTPLKLKKDFGSRKLNVEYASDEGATKFAQYSLDNLKTDKEFLKLIQSGIAIETIHSKEASLDEVFIQVTGQECSL